MASQKTVEMRTTCTEDECVTITISPGKPPRPILPGEIIKNILQQLLQQSQQAGVAALSGPQQKVLRGVLKAELMKLQPPVEGTVVRVVPQRVDVG